MQAFKRMARWIKQISKYWIRVGATQNLLALDIDLVPLMQADRWKTNRMPMRHGEHVLAARGGMARAAQELGRAQEDGA